MIKSRFFTYPSFLLFTTQPTFSAYLLIKSSVGMTSVKKHLVNPQVLSFLFCGEKDKYAHSFSDGLLELSHLGLLTSVGNEYYVYEDTPVAPPFNLIYEEEFDKIVRSGKNNVMALLLHYCRILNSLDYTIKLDNRTGVIGHMSSMYFTNTYNVPYNSVLNYSKSLEDIGVLYINHAGFNPKNKLTNLYGRKVDENLIKQYANRFNNSDKSNFHRSVSARYNRFINNQGVFSTEEIKQLYHDCEIYNQDVLSMGHPEKAKPLDKIKPL